MGFLWGLVRIVGLSFAVIVVALIVIDGSLLANLFKKTE